MSCLYQKQVKVLDPAHPLRSIYVFESLPAVYAPYSLLAYKDACAELGVAARFAPKFAVRDVGGKAQRPSGQSHLCASLPPVLSRAPDIHYQKGVYQQFEFMKNK